MRLHALLLRLLYKGLAEHQRRNVRQLRLRLCRLLAAHRAMWRKLPAPQLQLRLQSRRMVRAQRMWRRRWWQR